MRVFYGWVIVGAAFVIKGLAYPSWHLFSIFYVAMLAEFGWSRGETAAAFSLFTVVYALGAAGVGRLVVRYGARRVIPVGGLVLATGVAATSLVQERWHLYLLYGVVTALGLAGCGSIPNVSTVQNWFIRRRGLALGVASAGIGVGMMVLAPIVQMVISAAGWRVAYLVLGTVTLVIIPVAFLHRPHPGVMGLRPDGDAEAASAAPRRPLRPVADPTWASREWTVGRAVRTSRYRLLFAGYVLGMFSSNVVLVHQVAALTDAGYERLVAASVVGLVGFLGSGAKVMWGVLSDRLGRELTFTLGGAALITAEVLLAFVPPGAPAGYLYVYILVTGLGYGIFAPLMPAMAADLFQGPHFAAVYGSLYLAHALGSGGGPFVAGFLFDLTGRYTLPLGLAVAALACACILFWLAGPRQVRRVAGQQAMRA